MKQLFDFFPILLFFILYKFYLDLPDDLILSIGVAKVKNVEQCSQA